MRRAEEKFELQSVKECNNLAYMAKSVGKGQNWLGVKLKGEGPREVGKN